MNPSPVKRQTVAVRPGEGILAVRNGRFYFMNTFMSEENIPEIPELPEYAAELEAELACGKPFAYDPATGIRKMEERIEGLQNEISAVLRNTNLSAESVESERRRLLPQLTDARNRLAQYKLQLDGRN